MSFEEPRPAPADSAGRLALVCAIWAAALLLLPRYGVFLIPLGWARQLTLEAYLSITQFVALGVGLGAAFAALESPESAIPLRAAGGSAPLRALLLAPAAYAASTTAAFFIARPTLLAELLEGGRARVQENTGQFGRELVAAPVPLLIFWGFVVSPLGEELFFRGVAWTFAKKIVQNDYATLVLITAAFALLHWDMPGGLGIVRLVSAAGLGLCCGLSRIWSRNVTTPLVLHASYNALSIASVRRWVVTESFPTKYGVPTLLSAVGAVLSVGVLLMFVSSRRRSNSAPE